MSVTADQAGEGVDGIVGPRTDRERRRFEAYCRWSLHLLLFFAVAMMVLHSLAGGLIWAEARGASHGVGLVTGGVGAAMTIVWSATAAGVLELVTREKPVPRALVVAFSVLAVAVTLGLSCLLDVAEIHEKGAAAGIVFGPVPLAVTGAVAMLLWPRRHVLVGTVIGMAAVYAVHAYGPPAAPHPVAIAFIFMTVWICVLVLPTAALTHWMIQVVRRLARAREVAADLAVAEERLRFSRDLHDVFGRTLSTVAVKSELAAELARRGDHRAPQEMMAVRDLAQTALSDVRGLVRGYRRIELGDEVAGARSVLRAAGIRTRVIGFEEAGIVARLPEPVSEAFAWVVREAVTNVLRHGQATQVRLALEARENGVELCVENTSTQAFGRSGDVADGTGLIGLRERLDAVGGTLMAGPSESGFTVRAVVPVPESGEGRSC